MNPHKRTIYDTLGIEGLKQKWWAPGVKAMDPEEFKIWLQEQVRKHQVTEVMSLVNSRGDITIALDVSGLQFKEAVEVVGPNGRRAFQLRNMPLVKLTKYVARHSFTVPLEGLGKLLTTPFPTFRGSAAKDEPSPPPKPKAQTQSQPTLMLAAFLGGIPVATQSHRRTYIASPGLSAHLAHSFPAVHPATPRCIGTVLAGLDLEAASTIFPERVVSTSVSKSFGSSRLTVKPIFSTSPLRAPPIVEASYVSSVGKRSSFFIQYNTGATPWPSATSQLLSGPPPTSLLTIGYTLQPASGAPAADDTDDTDATPSPRPPHTSRSKATETWRITATAGVLVGGGQLGLSWGRTFFLGTRIGAAPRIPGPRREGIRINIDAGTNGTSGATLAVRASRRIFTHTRIGVGLGVSAGKDGVVLSLTWTRLGQKIALPVVVAPVPDVASVLYAVLVPVTAYGLLEVAWLRPRQRARDRAEVETLGRRVAARVARGRRRAEEVVELMRGAVEAGQKRSRELGGLVVLEAVYGPRSGGGGAGAGRYADVTIAVAALVEGEQMVIPRGVTKVRWFFFFFFCPFTPSPGCVIVLMGVACVEPYHRLL